MKNLVVVTLLLGSFATGCQNSNLAQSGSTSPSRNAIATPTSTTAQKPLSSSQSEVQPSVAATSPVVASPQNLSQTQKSCQISAFVIDKDPKGLNVRSGPGTNYKIIGNLPTTQVGVIVDLAASQGKWVQLTKAESPEKVEFQGTGWVSSQLLGTSTRSYGTDGVSVYSSANPQSSVIGRIPPETGVKLLGCDQEWAMVEYEGLKGWIEPEAQCPNPLTTCP